MASVTLQVRDVFLPTTSVGAYPRSQWSTASPPAGGSAPPGSAAATATVAADGTLTFTGLSASTEYVASAQVSGVWTHRNFFSPAAQGGSTELAYAQVTSSQSGISTVADLTGLSITFTIGSRPVMIELFIPLYTQVTLAGVPFFFITDASNNEIGRGGAFSLAAGGGGGGIVVRARLPAGTGVYTAKARAQTSAGTLTVNTSNTGASTYHPYIQACEV